MSYLRLFCKLPFIEKQMLLEATVLLILAYSLVRWIKFQHWSRFLGKTIAAPLPTNVSEEQSNVALRVSSFIRRFNHLVGNRFTCLMQAIVGKRMLDRRNIPNTLMLGVSTKHNETGGVNMEAHAWLQVGDLIVLGGEIRHHFTIIRNFQSS